MTLDQLLPYLKNASNTCEDAELRRQVNLALQTLNDSGIYVGSIIRAKLWTFDGNFCLPREMRRAISVIQCDSNGVTNSGYYQIDSQGLYIAPEYIQDAPIVDIGDGPLEVALFSPSKLYVSCDYAQDAGAVVQIQGRYADIPVISQDASAVISDHQNLTLTTTLQATQMVYQVVTSITKPVTKGPIRVVAETASGQKYLVLVAGPEETYPMRRRVRFSDLYQPHNAILRATKSNNSLQIDFADEPMPVGTKVLLTGWTPSFLNGMHAVAAVSENSLYIQSSLLPSTPTSEAVCVGQFLTPKLLQVTGTRQFVYLTDGNSIVPFTNIPAIRMALRAVAKFEGDDFDTYSKYMGQAMEMLREEVKTYGLDATNQAARTEAYRFAASYYPEHSIGAVASRIAIDLRKSIKVPITDMIRFVAEAEERILTSGQYNDAVVPRIYTSDEDGRITLEDDCYAIMAAKLTGIPGSRIQLESRYYLYEKDPYWSYHAGQNGFGGFGQGTWTQGCCGSAGFGATSGESAIPLQADFVGRLVDQGDRTWLLLPQCPGRCIDALVRLRSVRYSGSPLQEMVFKNFAALKCMVEAVLAKDLKDVQTENAMHQRAIDLADKDLGASRGGAQVRSRMSRWQKQPTYNLR